MLISAPSIKHTFRLGADGKIVKPDPNDVHSLKDARMEDAFHQVCDSLYEIGSRVSELVDMDGSSAVISPSAEPSAPKKPSVIDKVLDWSAGEKYALAQKDHRQWQIGGRDRATTPGLVVAVRNENRYGLEGEARFEPSATRHGSALASDAKRGLFSGLQSVDVNYEVTNARRDEVLDGGYQAVIHPESLSFRRQGDLDTIVYNTRRHNRGLDSDIKLNLLPGSTTSTTVLINRATGTLTFEQSASS